MSSLQYPGSQLFSGVAQLLNCEIDQLNFLVSQLLAIAAGVIYRFQLTPSLGAPHLQWCNTRRHLASFLLGFAILTFCFGRDAFHMVFLTTASFILLHRTSVKHVHLISLFFAMSYLSCIHFSNLFQRPMYYMDITGPLMVVVMKVTLLAYNVHDGRRSNSAEFLADKPELRRMALRTTPSIVEYYGYVFNFHTVLVGPALDFVHYRHFIEYGMSPSSAPDKGQVKSVSSMSAWWPVSSKFFTALICALLAIYIAPLAPHTFFSDEMFYAWPMWRQWVYLIVTGTMARFKYYGAWLMADSVCNASLLGVCDEVKMSPIDGSTAKPNWNAVSNVDIASVELGSNFRHVLLGWNKSTGRWLRALVYCRTRLYATSSTYILSALWHGFHPGYYITFSVAALCTLAARKSRRHLRPIFLQNRISAGVYHCVGFVSTRLALAYLQLPFVILDTTTTFRVYRHLWFSLHLVCIGMIVFLPRLFNVSLPKSAENKLTTTETSTNTEQQQQQQQENNNVKKNVVFDSEFRDDHLMARVNHRLLSGGINVVEISA